ncbi:MAG: hypothetical protein FJ225_03165 [Lentisphaerae bacterium]|nr:hypothetical protein [Lentisphaerota bacterium]
MTVRQVIRLRGAPKARLVADGQVVLLYPDVELTSADGRTISHQDTPAPDAVPKPVRKPARKGK